MNITGQNKFEAAEAYDDAEVSELGTLALGRDWYARLSGRDPDAGAAWSKSDIRGWIDG